MPTKPTFSGCGMTTNWELPWMNNEDASKLFLKSNEYIKKNFIFTGTQSHGVDSYNYDEGMWIWWTIAFAARYVITFATEDTLNFVECGVGDGISAFHTLSQLKLKQRPSSKTKMWLYDAWAQMRSEYLLPSEMAKDGAYSELSIDLCKRNLKEFDDMTIYNQGYMPDVFEQNTNHPDRVNCLHIDVNSAKPTIAALEFFYPRMQERSIIIFDDYGGGNYKDMRKLIDEFLADKPGVLLEIPTGRAFFFM